MGAGCVFVTASVPPALVWSHQVWRQGRWALGTPLGLSFMGINSSAQPGNIVSGSQVPAAHLSPRSPLILSSSVPVASTVGWALGIQRWINLIPKLLENQVVP